MFEHGPRVNRQKLEEAAAMFKVLADPARLQTLIILAEHERDVGDVADIEGDKLTLDSEVSSQKPGLTK
jgi:DNA-binding transcriptional ArsR family regulator